MSKPHNVMVIMTILTTVSDRGWKTHMSTMTTKVTDEEFVSLSRMVDRAKEMIGRVNSFPESESKIPMLPNMRESIGVLAESMMSMQNDSFRWMQDWKTVFTVDIYNNTVTDECKIICNLK